MNAIFETGTSVRDLYADDILGQLARTGADTKRRSANEAAQDAAQDATEEIYIIELIPDRTRHHVVGPQHWIAGEPFYLEKEDDLIYIRHERWSLIGCGESLVAAEQDLLQEARDLFPIYTSMPVSKMDHEAARLRDFLFSVI